MIAAKAAPTDRTGNVKMPDYVAHATTVGGRNGRVETSDGLLKADLSIPKSIRDPARKFFIKRRSSAPKARTRATS
jgi:hypothetical protein